MPDQDRGVSAAPVGVEQVSLAPESRRLLLDESLLTSAYANVIQVTGTAEEIILDVGFDWPAVEGREGASGRASRRYRQRIVLGFASAKRLWRALDLAVKRHEATFGAIQPDIRQRLVRRPS